MTMDLTPICYVLRDPRDNRPRYVGQAISPAKRLKEHVNSPGTPARAKWIAELKALDLLPTLETLDGGTEAGWIERLKPDLNGKTNAHGGGRSGAGRRPSTGSSVTRPVTFRLGAEDYDRASRASDGLEGCGGTTGRVNAFARAALRWFLDRADDE